MPNKAVIRIMTYNQDDVIATCLESVLHQTCKDIDIIICDNGSTDRTKDIIERYMSIDNRIHYIRFEVHERPTFDEKILLETTHEVLLQPDYAEYYMDISPNMIMDSDFISEASEHFGSDIIIGKPLSDIDTSLFSDPDVTQYTADEFAVLYSSLLNNVGILYRTDMSRHIYEMNAKYYPEIGMENELKKALTVFLEYDCTISFLKKARCHNTSTEKILEKIVDINATNFIDGCAKFNNLATRVIDRIVINKDASITYIAHLYVKNYLQFLDHLGDRDPVSKLDYIKKLIINYEMDTVAISKDIEYFGKAIADYIKNFTNTEILYSAFDNFVARWYMMTQNDNPTLKTLLYYTLLIDEANPYHFGTDLEGTTKPVDIAQLVALWNAPDLRIDDIMTYIRTGKVDLALATTDEVLQDKPFNKQTLMLRLILDATPDNNRLTKQILAYVYGNELVDLAKSQAGSILNPKTEEEQKVGKYKPRKKLF